VSDQMIPIAIINSRSETMVVASLLDTPRFGEFSSSYGLRRAVVKFLLLWIGIVGLLAIPRILYDPEFWTPSLAIIPLSVLGIPVNPQGHSEYFLDVTGEA